MPERLPCCWPKLPEAADVLPYLREIDASRWYTNFGPLSERFRRELAGHYGVEPDHVVTVANGTQGLVLSLMIRARQPGGLCVMPSWTFVATAHAARMAGLRPCFADVDPETWALDPERLLQLVRQDKLHPAAVVPVCPFGAPVDTDAWEAFEKDTSIPVIIDAAAAFDSVRPSSVPCMISLHATKALGVGEGGLLIAKDADFIREIEKRSNFGFYGSRRVDVPATNAKMSEYHAAVGLAALAAWPERRSSLLRAAARYVEGLSGVGRLRFLPGFGSAWISSTCTLETGDSAVEWIARLQQLGIEARRWWGDGCHREKAFLDAPREELPVTERLSGSVLCLPFFAGLTPRDIDRVIEALAGCLRRDA